MKKENKKQKLKTFSLDSVEKGARALYYLICQVENLLMKYEVYMVELNELKLKYFSEDKNLEDILIPAKEYEDIKFKLFYCQNEMLKYIADCQNNSFSYKSLRKTLKKEHYLKKGLSIELEEILNELLNIRNSIAHNLFYNLNSQEEVIIKNLDPQVRPYTEINYFYNPVTTKIIDNYDFLMLESLFSEQKRRGGFFEKVLASMKKDYEEIYLSLPDNLRVLKTDSFIIPLEKVIYDNIHENLGFYDLSNDVGQIAGAVHRGKYDGSDSSYNDFAINKI